MPPAASVRSYYAADRHTCSKLDTWCPELARPKGTTRTMLAHVCP